MAGFIPTMDAFIPQLQQWMIKNGTFLVQVERSCNLPRRLAGDATLGHRAYTTFMRERGTKVTLKFKHCPGMNLNQQKLLFTCPSRGL